MRTVEEAFTAWSKSGLATIVDGCSWQSYLSKVMQLPDPGSPATLAGTAYHAAIEHHERARIVQSRGADIELPTLGHLAQVAVRAISAGADDIPDEQWHLHGSDPDEVINRVEIALNHWWHTDAGDKEQPGSLRDIRLSYRPILTEQYFRIDTDWSARPLHGYIDAVCWDPDEEEWVVIDDKSASNFGRWPHGGDGHEVEAAVYTLGALKAAGIPVTDDTRVRMEWHVARTAEGQNSRFEGARLIRRTVDRFDLQLLEDHIRIADRTVDEGLFATNPGWNLCSQKWCAFWRPCQVTGELSPEVVHAARQLQTA